MFFIHRPTTGKGGIKNLQILITFKEQLAILILKRNFSMLMMLTKKHCFSMKLQKICDALRNLVTFVQFKKREKHPWRSVIFSKVQAWYQLAQNITYYSAFHSLRNSSMWREGPTLDDQP